MSEELVPVSLWLGGRSYRIRIKPAEEAVVMQAVKLADEKIMEMRRHYAGKDDQDFIAMTLLSYAIETSTNAAYDPVLNDAIAGMLKKVTDAISDDTDQESK